MAEKLTNELVFARPAPQDDRAGGVPELVHRHPQSGGLVDAGSDLTAERDFALGALTLTWEQPVLIPAPQQMRQEVVDIFVDEPGDVPVQTMFELHPVFDVVIRGTQASSSTLARRA